MKKKVSRKRNAVRSNAVRSNDISVRTVMIVLVIVILVSIASLGIYVDALQQFQDRMMQQGMLITDLTQAQGHASIEIIAPPNTEGDAP